MDTLAGMPEAVEAEFSEAIVARDDALAVLAAAPGLGPPDLVWLQKGRGPWAAGTDAAASAGEGSHGYYHFQLGGDVSSSGAIAGNFARLTARVERPGLLAGFWQGPELSVQRGFYCVYDAISRRDLRCELCVPGGVVCGLVDSEGNLHEAKDPLLWQQVQVSAFLRAVLYDPEMTVNGGCITVADALPSRATEQQLLTAVESLYSCGVLPAALDPVATSQGYGVAPEHADLALYALWHHFRRRQRWRAARAFFARLAAFHPPAAVWEAAALRAAGRGDRAVEVLGEALEAAPSSAALLVAMAAECMRLQELDTAARLARRAVHIRVRCRPAWLILARCYAAEGAWAEALVTLNAVPTPPLPRDERELLLVVPPPDPVRVTAPQVPAYQSDLQAARALALEESDTGGTSRLLAYLPGAILLNKEPLEAGPWPDASPNRVTRTVLGAVYSQLQDMVAALGWDGFLAVRSSVFVMHQDGRSPRAAAAVSAPGTLHEAAKHHHQEQQQQHGDPPVHEHQPANKAVPAQQQQHVQAAAVSPVPAAASPAPAGTNSHSVRRTSGAGGKAEGAGAAAFYASRIQAALGSTSPAPATEKQRQQQPLAQDPQQEQAPEPLQQQQQQQQKGDSGSQAGPEAAAAPMFGPMAGRVLLLGRHSRRLDSAEAAAEAQARWRRSSSSSSIGVPSSSLAARGGMEGLSRLTSATPIAPLATANLLGPGRQGSNPLLWAAVFGSAVQAAVPPAGGLVAAPNGLRPIRIRPLGEACEQSSGDAAATGPRPLGEATEGPAEQPEPEQQADQQQQPGAAHAESLLLRGRSPGDPGGGMGATARTAQRHGPLYSAGSGALSPGAAAPRGNSISGSQTRSLQADREAIATGRRLVRPAADEAGHGSQLRWDVPSGRWSDTARDAGVRLCVRWLDELVVALWHDLSAFLEWRCLDQSLRESQGMTHAELVLRDHGKPHGGSTPASPLRPSSEGAGPKPPPLTTADWARRGTLAERLGHTHEARAAFRVAVALGFNLTAYTALLRLEAAQASTADALMSAQQMLLWHEVRAVAAAAGGGGGVPSHGVEGTLLPAAPTPVSWFLGEMAAVQGPDRLRAALTQDSESPHPLLLRDLDDWARLAASDTVEPAAPPALPSAAAEAAL